MPPLVLVTVPFEIVALFSASEPWFSIVSPEAAVLIGDDACRSCKVSAPEMSIALLPVPVLETVTLSSTRWPCRSR